MTSVVETSKRIVSAFLEVAVKNGAFSITINRENALSLVGKIDENLFKVCIAYLVDGGYIKTSMHMDGSPQPYTFTAKAVDFAENK